MTKLVTEVRVGCCGRPSRCLENVALSGHSQFRAYAANCRSNSFISCVSVDRVGGVWDASSNTQGTSNLLGDNIMNAIATKLQVTAAAVAIAAGAAFAPVAANAAPAVELPAAPVQVMGDIAAQPQGLLGVFVVQFTGAVTRTSTWWTRMTITNYQSLLEARPDSIFAPFWQSRINRLNQQLASYAAVEMSACAGGTSYSIVAGSYGGVTRGACV